MNIQMWKNTPAPGAAQTGHIERERERARERESEVCSLGWFIYLFLVICCQICLNLNKQPIQLCLVVLVCPVIDVMHVIDIMRKYTVDILMCFFRGNQAY